MGVKWFPYNKETFEKARREDKPVLIDIGAKWCHWCHVMDRESYSDAEIASFLNENFICIKVDRDEMPNIDRMYQEIVSSISGEGGWPLTVFATPEGKVFYGGTYFPKEERFGKPPFLTVLKAVLNAYKKEKKKTLSLASQIMDEVEKRLKQTSFSDISDKILEKGIDSILSLADPVYGGFGFAQKFPMPTAIRFLLSVKTRFDDSIKFADHTLDEMQASGIHDHIFGGFFRYTIDREWIIPHFEKIIYDNGELLINYSIACRMGKNYENVAEGIVSFARMMMTESGFFTSIDADFRGVEGGFYTYSYDELEEVLEYEELKAFELFYGVTRDGGFHGRNHLRIIASKESVAEMMNLEVVQLDNILESAKDKLRNYRMRFFNGLNIDRNVYTSYSSIMLSGMFYFGCVFERNDVIEEAERKIKKMLERFDGVLYRKDEMEGLLEDYAFLSSALIDCYTATQKDEYLEIASEIMNVAIKEFYSDGVFSEKTGTSSINDINHRSPLTQIIQNLTSLGHLMENQEYIGFAEEQLKKYAGIKHGLFDAGYLLALQTYLAPIIVEADREELLMLRKYINHNIMVRVGEGSICFSDRCLKADSEEIERLLRKELLIS
jgi:hypothetical protein